MEWIKKGLIFKPDGSYEWSVSHAQVPFATLIEDNILRIYFGTRDQYSRTLPSYIEVDAENPKKVLYVHDKPILGLGEPGSFDDCGVMPSWIVDYDNRKYLYYTGWNVSNTVSYRLSIGLAVSEDGGKTFDRMYKGPILDRCHTEPFWCAQPCVFIENGVWKMWYLSCTKWETINGHSEPFYLVKYAESIDGIYWNLSNKVCVGYDADTDAIGRPGVVIQDNIYKMYYSYRKAKNYRTDVKKSYKIGFAESKDGISWIKKDNIIDLQTSNDGWDSIMLAYPHVYEYQNKKYMLYNGNGFGHSGFGYAILNQENHD